MSMTQEEISACLERAHEEFVTAWDKISTARLGDKVRTGWGGDLKIAWRSFGRVSDSDVSDVLAGYVKPIEVSDVLAGYVKPIEALLTEDGLFADTRTWHDGDPTGDSVYVERWDATRGRYFHGYVDPTSRMVVQTG